MADSTQPLPNDVQTQLTVIKKQIEQIKAWQEARTQQQIQFPLDRASTRIISTELGL